MLLVLDNYSVPFIVQLIKNEIAADLQIFFEEHKPWKFDGLLLIEES